MYNRKKTTYNLSDHTNIIFLLFVIAATFIIFYPIFSAEYLYTDEATQLWYTSKNINFATSVPQGRYITYKIFGFVFANIHTVHGVIYARLFSFLGWLICLPAWYFIINKLIIKNNLPKNLVFLSMIYIICMPPFIIYVAWAACIEMFLGCIAALVSGYLLYEGIKIDKKPIAVSPWHMGISILLGITALFIYQNCFGCFFIPFFIHFIAIKKITPRVYTGLLFSLVIFILYYFLFKYSLVALGIEASNRSAMATDPINKLLFFIARPLPAAFHFTFLMNEKSVTGVLIYLIIVAICLSINLANKTGKSLLQKFTYLTGIFVFALLTYLPSLIVKENHSSHRTLFALDFIIFLFVAETIFSSIKTVWSQSVITACTGIFFLVTAWFNYHKQFLEPVLYEYSIVKNFIALHYQPGITSIHFIFPSEDGFKEKYGITPSWDEFGVPSTAKKWVPEPLLQQLIFEKTGNRQIAEKTVIKCWNNKADFDKSGEFISNTMLLINMEEALRK